MLLLGFGSKARQGKDTAATAIKTYYDKKNEYFEEIGIARKKEGLIKVGIFKYAAALYEEVNAWLKQAEDFGSVPGQLYFVTDENQKVHPIPEWVQPDPNPEISPLAPYGKHPKLLQWWGTEFRRNNFGQDYWVKKTFANIPANLDIAMITDVRFPNEATAIEERGGYTIQCIRLREDGTPFVDSSRPADHPSETALDNWNWNFRIVTPNGHAALTGEVAITYAEYLRELNRDMKKGETR
jgi:hypothetical protein